MSLESDADRLRAGAVIARPGMAGIFIVAMVWMCCSQIGSMEAIWQAVSFEYNDEDGICLGILMCLQLDCGQGSGMSKKAARS